MQSRRHAPESGDHGIDLAPMLDFCINLLIFFIITTSFIKEAGVVVYKPAAQTAQHEDSGNLHIERPDDTVVIIADRASKAGVVAKVMDEVRLAGIKFQSIAADPNAPG